MTADELDILREAVRNASDAYREETADMMVRRSQEEVAAAKSRNIKEAATKAGAAAVAALGGFSKSLLSTESGMSKYNAGLNAAGNAAFDIGKQFGVVGFALGGLAKLFTAGMEAVNKQNDAMLKAYDTLGQFGTASGLTTRGILDLATKAGYSSHNLDIFTKHVSSLGEDLLALGTTTASGVEAFTRMIAVSQKQRNAYNLLGISQEELTKRQSDYVKTTIGAGISLAKSPDLLMKNSLRYVDILNEMAALTGMNRDKLQESLDTANNNINYQVHMYELGKKEKVLREEALAAEREGNVELRNKKLAEAETTHKTIENTEKVAMVIGKFADTTQQAGILAKLTGGAWTEVSAKLSLTMPGLSELGPRLKKGEDVSFEIMELAANGSREMLDSLGGVFKLGEAGAAAAEAVGISSKNIKFLADWNSKTVEERKEAFKSMQEEMDKRKEGTKLFDDVKNSQSAQLTLELQMRQSMDGVVKVMSGPFTKVFETLTTVMSGFAKGIAKFTKLIGGPDLTGIFETSEEISGKLKNTGDEISGVGKNIKETQEAMSLDPSKGLEFSKREAKRTLGEYGKTVGERMDLEKRRDDTADPVTKSILSQQISDIKDKEERDRQRVSDAAEFDRGMVLSFTNKGKKEEFEKYLNKLKEREIQLKKEELTLKERQKEKPVEMKSEDSDRDVRKSKEKLKFAEIEAADKRKKIEDETLAEIIQAENEKGDSRRFSDKASMDAVLADMQRSDHMILNTEIAKKKDEIKARKEKEISDNLKVVQDAVAAAKQRFAEKELEDYKKKEAEQANTPPAGAGSEASAAPGKSSDMTGYLKKVAQVESSGDRNAKAKTSGAAGLFQFTPGTWKAMTKSMGLDYTLEDRLDPKKAAKVAAAFTKQNKEILERDDGIGRNATDSDLYLAHFLGATGAKKFITAMNKNPSGKASDGAGSEQMTANASIFYQDPKRKLGERTLSEVYMLLANKINKAETVVASGKTTQDVKDIDIPQARHGGLFSGPTTGYPVELHGDELVTPIADLQQVTKKDTGTLVDKLQERNLVAETPQKLKFTKEELGASLLSEIQRKLVSITKDSITPPATKKPNLTPPATIQTGTQEVQQKLTPIKKDPVAPVIQEVQQKIVPAKKDQPIVEAPKPQELKLTRGELGTSLLAEMQKKLTNLFGDDLAKTDLTYNLKKTELPDSPKLPAPADFTKAINEMVAKVEGIAKSKESVTAPQPIETKSPNEDMSKIAYEMMDMLSRKFDTMIDRLNASNDTQEKLLMHSRT